jgi:hypothetical protein
VVGGPCRVDVEVEAELEEEGAKILRWKLTIWMKIDVPEVRNRPVTYADGPLAISGANYTGASHRGTLTPATFIDHPSILRSK